MNEKNIEVLKTKKDISKMHFLLAMMATTRSFVISLKESIV